jgi:hypothetical protein
MFRDPRPFPEGSLPPLEPPRKPFTRRFAWTRQRLLFTGLLCLFLLSGVIGGWSAVHVLFHAQAAGPQAQPASLTLQQFLAQGRQDGVYRGPVKPPTNPPQVALGPGEHLADYSTLPASAEPPTMQPITAALSATMLAGGSGTTGLDLRGSDQRLEVLVPPGALDVSQATVVRGTGTAATPTAASGPFSLRITEVSGHAAGLRHVLGTYQIEVLDTHGQPVSNVHLRQPLTLIYHYQPWEMRVLELDPNQILLSWPVAIATAQQHKQSTQGLVIPMHNHAQTDTLTAQTTVLGPGPLVASGSPNIQSPPVPLLASVGGNNGQVSYDYPLQVAPGAAGFAPKLVLHYTSNDPNNRHSRTSPAGDEGDGWSLTLGSISSQVYANGSAASGTWYALNQLGDFSDRLVADTTVTSGTFFQTQHLSHYRIQQVTSSQTNQPCFHVWDTSGTYYEFGCTPDSLQWTNSSGSQQNYQWNLDRMVAPNEGPAASNVGYDLISVTYLQDCVPAASPYALPCASSATVRDAAIKQITYGFSTSVSSIGTVLGTVDFSYKAPFSYGTWASSYGTNYNCQSSPPSSTTLRCDDPVTFGSVPAPDVMSTLSLQSVTSYVGSDSSGSKDASYSFSYSDLPYTINCYDEYTLVQEACAGEHLLTQVVPTIYLNGTGHTIKPLLFSYSGLLADTYFDSQHQNTGGSAYGGASYWAYLTRYIDTNTGIGGQMTYATAYSNSHGTPEETDSNGVLHTRHDPLYCTEYPSDCAASTTTWGSPNPYANPNDRAWSVQVVTQLATWGTDSGSSQLSPAVTTYTYQLAKTGTWSSGNPFCYPYPSTSNPTDEDCVGDNWIPANNGVEDSNWQDYYDSEFHGFYNVAITSPARNLTEQYYYSTEGWGTAGSNSGNYNSGAMFQQDIYDGTNATNPPTQETITQYTGNNQFSSSTSYNSCNGNLSPVYPVCGVWPLWTETAQEGQTPQVNSQSSAPWVRHTYTYDDYNPGTGLGNGYHNLLSDQVTSSNAPTVTTNWTYYTNNQTVNGWTYYVVNKVQHSEVDDSSGHVWQCQYDTYDQGAPSGVPTPSAGWLTTVQTYANGHCTGSGNPSSPLTTSYTGYDAYGNVVATVDALAQANPTLYSGEGCSASPVIMASAWGQSTYTSCTSYQNESVPTTQTNAFNQATQTAYTTGAGKPPSFKRGMRAPFLVGEG